MNIRQFLLGAAAAGVVGYSCFMIAFSWHQLVDVFRLGDPTGWFGFIMQVGGFAANLCAITVAGCVLASLRGVAIVPKKIIRMVFGCKLLEALSLLPCGVGIGDGFCGLWWVVLSYVTSPIVLIVTLGFLLRSGNKLFRHIGQALVGSVAMAGLLAFIALTPKNPEACMALEGITNRAACLDKFAQRDRDVTICRKIEFRSTRFNCLYNVARETDSPPICEEITDAPGMTIAAYETPAAATRGLCYYLLGFKQRSAALCAKVDDEQMRTTCLNNAVTSPK